MRILIVEDDNDTADFISNGVTDLGHDVARAADGEDALRIGLAENFDIILLDRMMPVCCGIEVLRRLRAAAIQTPVLLLTAKGSIADRVEGLDAGADDYLVKPFVFAELVARINALVRRGASSDLATRIEVGSIVLDLRRREVTRSGKPVHLQPREFAILELLMRNVNRPVTRTMFLEQVWRFDFDPLTNIVESHLSRLRNKLRGSGDDPIETVRGLGYRMRQDA